ncbi:MAG: NAD-dependent dihydropyrimidine dehydrogenase subunit PreA [Desulfovibrio sp.]
MEQVPSLEVSVCGIPLENPFLLASAPPTARIECIRKAFALGWAGAVLKTISPTSSDMQDSTPRFGGLRVAKKHIVGFENFELLSRKSLTYWKEGICSLKREFPKKAIIASIMAPVERSAWQSLVRDLQTAPIDAFELNFSCPHGMPERGMGMAIGTSAEISARITAWVKEAATVPVFVKLSPNVTDIAAIALAVQSAGADGLAAINTVQSLVGVDLESLNPLPSVCGQTTFGGYSGLAVKPIGLRCVAQACAATKLPMLAMGGISSWEDAVEYMALGGNAVQVCTEVMLNGYAVIKPMLAGLENYLRRKGFSSLAAIHGAALPKITTHTLLDRTKYVARLDAARCVRCGKCVTLCDESGYSAITATDGVPCVTPSVCDGCGLCVVACPNQAFVMTAAET